MWILIHILGLGNPYDSFNTHRAGKCYVLVHNELFNRGTARCLKYSLVHTTKMYETVFRSECTAQTVSVFPIHDYLISHRPPSGIRRCYSRFIISVVQSKV